jgi:adenylate cyclase
MRNGGTVDKFIGDAVMAFWGAPVDDVQHARHCMQAALEMQQAMESLQPRFAELGAEGLSLRIGLNSGPAIVGNMGSRSRFNYTMMGDTVNLAARMESGAKQWGAYVMCTDETRRACETHGGDRVIFRPLGKIVVKGRTKAVPIYEIAALKESVGPDTRECVGIFAAGLEAFYRRDWAGARACFEQSARIEPNQPGKTPGVSSNPSLVYQEIVDDYRVSPPAADWDGVRVMTEK